MPWGSTITAAHFAAGQAIDPDPLTSAATLPDRARPLRNPCGFVEISHQVPPVLL